MEKVKNSNTSANWEELHAALYQEKNREAIDAFKQVLIFDPKRVYIMVNVGICYSKLGRSIQALQEY